MQVRSCGFLLHIIHVLKSEHFGVPRRMVGGEEVEVACSLKEKLFIAEEECQAKFGGSEVSSCLCYSLGSHRFLPEPAEAHRRKSQRLPNAFGTSAPIGLTLTG